LLAFLFRAISVIVVVSGLAPLLAPGAPTDCHTASLACPAAATASVAHHNRRTYLVGDSPIGQPAKFATSRLEVLRAGKRQVLLASQKGPHGELARLSSPRAGIEQRGNQKIDENTRKPVVHYKLTAERDATDHIEFLFRATIDVPEGGTFNRNWLITARKDAATWKVSNFDDYE